MYSWDSGDYFPLVSGSSTNLVVKNQPQAVTLANPFRITLHQKKGQKNPWSKTPCASVQSVRFFDLRPVAVGSQDELLQGLSIFIF